MNELAKCEAELADRLYLALERAEYAIALLLARKPARDIPETTAEIDGALSAYRKARGEER